jgi:hypothetical protein
MFEFTLSVLINVLRRMMPPDSEPIKIYQLIGAIPLCNSKININLDVYTQQYI